MTSANRHAPAAFFSTASPRIAPARWPTRTKVQVIEYAVLAQLEETVFRADFD
jgi:hypothetical protein